MHNTTCTSVCVYCKANYNIKKTQNSLNDKNYSKNKSISLITQHSPY